MAFTEDIRAIPAPAAADAARVAALREYPRLAGASGAHRRFLALEAAATAGQRSAVEGDTLRSAHRNYSGPDGSGDRVGFRVARTTAPRITLEEDDGMIVRER